MTNPIVINVPHSKWQTLDSFRYHLSIPYWEQVYETLVLTQWFTDEIFDCNEFKSIVATASRLDVDTSRHLDDSQEPMSVHGMGCIYSHGTKGQRIRRELNQWEKDNLLNLFYHPHHAAILNALTEGLAAHNKCIFIDAHSFMGASVDNQDSSPEPRPDIYIGIHPTNSDPELCRYIADRLTECNYSICVRPWNTTCALPSQFYGDNRIMAIQIDINQDFYLDTPVPVYSPKILENRHVLQRKPEMYRLKNDLEDILLECQWIFIDKKPEILKTNPHYRRRLNSLLSQLKKGSLSKETSIWWHDSY